MTRFVINTEAPNVVSFVLTLRNEKNETLRKYSKRCYELYNEIKRCSKELAVVSYKLGLTLDEKLWMT